MKRAFIIGGGVTGLTCGQVLAREGYQVTVFEATDRIGGMAATIERDGFRFDLGPHKLYSPLPEPVEHVRRLFPDSDDLLSIGKVSQLHFQGRNFEYPLSISQLLRGIPRRTAVRYGLSFLRARARGGPTPSYAAFMRRQFGAELYEAVFGPAARKVFGEDEKLSAQLGEARFRGKNLITFLRQALGRKQRVDAVSFDYPRRGTGEVPTRMARAIESSGGRIITSTAVRRMERNDDHVCRIHTGTDSFDVDAMDPVIDTSPLQQAPERLDLPEEAEAAAARLRYRSLLLVYVTVKRPRIMENQWAFFPTSDVSFNRLSEPKNFSPDMAPEDQSSLVAEVTASTDLPAEQEPALVTRVVEDLARLGYLTPEEVLDTHTLRLQTGYPVWLVGFEKDRETLFSHLDPIRNLYPLGRQGLYQYVGVLDCVDMALRTTRFILRGGAHEGWTYLRHELSGYPVVD